MTFLEIALFKYFLLQRNSIMPYVVVSTQIRVENGPTIVGDEQSDPELMKYLDAQLVAQLGNNFSEYRCSHPPRVVLDKLELKGFKVLAMAGIGQTCVWTLHKPPEFLAA